MRISDWSSDVCSADLGVDVDALARGELAFHPRAAGVHEHPAVALELLHDEALAAEQAGEDLALEVDAHRHPARASQEAVLLAAQATAVLGQFHRPHRAGVGRCARDLPLDLAAVGERSEARRVGTKW